MATILKRNSKKLQIFLVFVLIVAALFPPLTVARAQDEVPPATEETTTEVESAAEEAPAEGETVVEEQSAPPAESETPVDEPVVEATEPAADEPAVEEAVTTVEVVETAEAAAEGAGEPAGEEEGEALPAESLAEVVDAMVETETVLVDADGEEIPLATEAAAEILSTATDPWFLANDTSGKIVGYTTIGGTCHSSVSVGECHEVANPVGAALADDRSTGQVVQILAGYYDEEVTIGKTVTLQGVANGTDLDAVIRKINLNVDISGWNHVLGEEVLVNSGAHIQDGIDIVQSDGTVSVAPGTYEEEAKDRTVNGGTAKYQFGLYVGKDKNGITVQGLKADGTPVTSYTDAAALIKTNATNNFGYSGILVEGDNVTFDGLMIGDNKAGNNKTFEILGDSFTLQNSQILPKDGGSVYIGDWNYDPITNTSYITEYKILGNYFAYGGSVDVSNGAGVTGSEDNRVISNNVFSGLQLDGSNAYWALTSFNGTIPSVGWFVYPVGGATITGNTYSNSSMYIRSRGTVVDSTFDWKSYWNDNKFDHGAVTLDNLGTFDIHEYSYTSGSYNFSNVRRIGNSIQAEIDISANGNTVLAGPGVFVENLVINKTLEVAGSGAGNTVIIPKVSNPNCGGAGGGSLCAGGSNVILVQANGVKIHDLTVDGDNPNLTSGEVSRGADIDARNGIITNHAAGVFNNLEVYNTEILNIFLRGLYASSGGTFNIHDNVVDNVNGDSQSIAIMNWNGSGIIADNKVTNSSDGIVSNWSRGTSYTGNFIENSGTGIHTDNYLPSWGTAPAGPETISGNTVKNNPNGYGIFVFAPFGIVTVSQNTIENVGVGLAAAGSNSASGSSYFFNNKVDGNNLPGSIGVQVTTDLWGWGYAPVTAYFYQNLIMNNEYGFFVEDQAQPWNDPVLKPYRPPYEVNLFAQHNAIVNNSIDVLNHTSYVAQMPANFWNDNNGPQNLDLASQVWVPNWINLGLNADPTVVNKRENSVLNSFLYMSDNPNIWAPLTAFWWFDPSQLNNFEQTTLGSVLNDVFTAGTTKGYAWLGSTFFGKNFFNLAVVEVVDPPDSGDGDGGLAPVVFAGAGGAGGPLAGVIPVTGGMNQLSCTEANTLVLASGNSVAFSAPLCGFDAGLNEESGSALPAPLPDGMTFVSGLSVNLQKAGTDFPKLPQPVMTTISFTIPADLAGKTLVILYWDAAANGGLGGWVEVPGSAGGTATVDNTGTFVLAYK